MNYVALDEFGKDWVFKHHELPIDEKDLSQIKPMTPTRSAVLWSTFIHREKDHPDFITEDDWQKEQVRWAEQEVFWEQAFEDSKPLPEEIVQHLDWQDNTTVYFCNHRDEVIETQFGVFKRHWHNFMFLADGSVLLGKKREQRVQFLSTGFARLGEK